MLKYAIARHHPDRCIATPVSGLLDWRRESASRWCWVWRGGWRRRCRRSRAGRQNPLEPPPDWILSWLPWAQLGGGKDSNETSHTYDITQVFLLILSSPICCFSADVQTAPGLTLPFITAIMNLLPPPLCHPRALLCAWELSEHSSR